jgi:hypothetical protein
VDGGREGVGGHGGVLKPLLAKNGCADNRRVGAWFCGGWWCFGKVGVLSQERPGRGRRGVEEIFAQVFC